MPSGVAAAGLAGFVGRSAELATLAGAAERARGGQGEVVWVSGPAGIGKTALLRVAGERFAADGLTVLRARGGQDPPAYGTARELFRPLGLTAESPLLEGAARGALPVLVPEAAAEDHPYCVVSGLYRLAVNVMGRGPLALVLDDVHGCDASTLAWLDFLLRRAGELPLLVVLGGRPERTSEIAAAVSGLPAAGHRWTLELVPFTAVEAAEFATRIFGVAPEPAFLDRARELAGGNPRLLRTLFEDVAAQGAGPESGSLEHLAGSGRAVLAKAVLAWTAEQPAHVRAVATAFAVLGRGDPVLVSKLVALPRELVAEACEILVRDELLAADRGALRLEEIRAALLATLSADERVGLRRRAADLLHDEGHPAEEIAAQLVGLPEAADVRTLGVLRDAAVEAAQRGDPRAAARYLHRVLEADPHRPATLVELAATLATTDPPAAIRHLRAALERTPDVRKRAELACRLPGLLGATRAVDALALLRPVIEQLTPEPGAGPAHVDLLQQLRTADLAYCLTTPAGTAEVLARRRAGSEPPGLPTPASRRFAGLASYVEMLRGESIARTLGLARHALVPAADDGGTSMLAAASALRWAGASAEANAALERLVADSARRADGVARANALAVRASVRGSTGDLSGARADAELVLGMPSEGTGSWAQVVARVCLASVLSCEGAFADGDRQLSLAGDTSFAGLFAAVNGTPAYGHRFRGDPAAALRKIEETGRRVEEAGIRNPVFVPWWLDAVELLDELGRVDEAVALAEQATERVRAWDTAESRGLALMAQGLVCRGNRAVELLSAAADELTRSPARLVQFRAEALCGRALLRLGDRTGARRRLRLVVEHAVRTGYLTMAATARELLIEAGGRMPKPRDGRLASLSRSEWRVAALAAEGASNRKIAEALFVTVRTVETHLSNVYRKLEVAGRVDLAAALGRPGAERPRGD